MLRIVYMKNQIVVYKPRKDWLCCCMSYRDRSNFQNILQEIDLSRVEKQIIQTRYLDILENFQKRAHRYSLAFFGGHFLVTVGSLFVPALLSIQNSNLGPVFAEQIYWATFVISILVTIANGILALFKIDKKYYFLNTTLERLRSEGWQYFGLTGRYSGHLIGHNKPTYSNQFVYFTHYIEKIKMKQVEEEYYKADEKTSQGPLGTGGSLSSGGNTSSSANQDLYPPSPDQPLNQMTSNIPEPVKEAVNSLIKSHKIIDKSEREKEKEEDVIVISEIEKQREIV
jgi:Protein of unknown function (DUF4231)